MLMGYTIEPEFEFIKYSSAFPGGDWTKRRMLIFEISILRLPGIKMSGPHSNPEKRFGYVRKLWFNDLRNHLWSHSHSILPNPSLSCIYSGGGRCREGIGNRLKGGLEVLLQDKSRKCSWGDICPKAKINYELIHWIILSH